MKTEYCASTEHRYLQPSEKKNQKQNMFVLMLAGLPEDRDDTLDHHEAVTQIKRAKVCTRYYPGTSYAFKFATLLGKKN